MSRRVEFIEAIMGILKVDAAYVPLQADLPEERMSKIILDCRPRAMICDHTALQRIMGLSLPAEISPVLISIAEGCENLDAPGVKLITPNQIRSFPPAEIACNNREDDLACVHYTSGSTGAPKGVMISHRNISEYISWAVHYIGISEQDRILGTAPFHFDMSLFDIYCSVFTGATLCIVNEKMLLFPRLLIDFAEKERTTVWKGVSSLLMYLARTGAVSAGRLPTMKKILFSGEVLPTKYLIQWMNMFPDKEFFNAYGPTEATGISMYFRVKQIPASPDERIPLGKPCENTEILLLNENHQPVPLGEPGEIYIKGVCVAKGYLNDPVRTAASFLDNPLNPNQREKVYKTGDFARLRPDGNYEFLGRKDTQVKYMGYRIELSDIEQCLLSTSGIRDAGALLSESNIDDVPELIAYVELDEKASIPDILTELRKKLPSYMLPKRILPIHRIPRANSGKIDRHALLAYHISKSA
jgi:amino acid adenylation domain-containing protein